MFKKQPPKGKRRKSVPWGDNVINGRNMGRMVAKPMFPTKSKRNGRRSTRAR